MPILTIAELPEFIRIADKFLSESERQDIIRYLAERPKEGDVMEGTGGVRKMRWGRGGQGKVVAFASSITFTTMPCRFIF